MFNATICEYYNKHHGTNYTLADYHSHKYWEVWGCSPHDSYQIVQAFLKDESFTNGIPVVQGAREALEVLHTRFDIFIVTSRHSDIHEITRDWIHSNFPGLIDHILVGNMWNHTGPKLTKEFMLRRIHADVFIDDNWQYIQECKHAVKKAILFGEYPWNTGADKPDGDDFVRCRSWSEVVPLLMKESFAFRVSSQTNQ